MQLRIESILDSHGVREDEAIHKEYDFMTKFMNKFFDI